MEHYDCHAYYQDSLTSSAFDRSHSKGFANIILIEAALLQYTDNYRANCQHGVRCLT